MTEFDRRHALRVAALGGLAVPLVAACGNDDSAPSDDPTVAATQDPGVEIAKTADVPVGSGVIVASDALVITQPTAGDFKCFSSICPHQKCPVTKVTKESIDCTCHGSKFSIKDGSVLEGPAKEGLAPQEITVKGDGITIA